MKKYLATMFMLASVIAAAESEIDFGGNLNLKFNEFTETEGKEQYSMNGNGNIFGTGDWKQSTSDNGDDNIEKFQGVLDLNMNIKVNEKVNIFTSFEGLTENFTGVTAGDEVTNVQESSTVRDNDPLMLKELKIDIDTDFADLTITNSFNYDFNKRVLAMQLEDNWGEGTPYGEGVYAKMKNMPAEAEVAAFMFQSSDTNSATSGDDNEQNVNQDDDGLWADYMVYGIDVKKNFTSGKAGLLAINTHDKFGDSGDSYDDDLDTQHYALNGEYNLSEMITLKGEFITAQYGSDVTAIDNYIANALSWKTASYDLSADGAKDDNNIIEASATIRPMADVEVNAGYKDVGEDYYGVLGTTHQMDSWLGEASFDASSGEGYDKGLYGDVSFLLPLDVKTTVSYQDFDLTRSASNDAEDTNEKELEAAFAFNLAEVAMNASYRLNTQTNGELDKDITFNDLNANASYKMQINDKVSNTVAVDLNFYTGDDAEADKNFSNEKRLKASSIAEYKYSEKITFKGEYRFGYATEDNDTFDATGMQNLLKAGVAYAVTPDCVLDLYYKYDNYALDRDATHAELSSSEYMKEAEHQWYDGAESWEHWTGHWTNDIAAAYEGYETHELCASINIKF